MKKIVSFRNAKKAANFSWLCNEGLIIFFLRKFPFYFVFNKIVILFINYIHVYIPFNYYPHFQLVSECPFLEFEFGLVNFTANIYTELKIMSV